MSEEKVYALRNLRAGEASQGRYYRPGDQLIGISDEQLNRLESAGAIEFLTDEEKEFREKMSQPRTVRKTRSTKSEEVSEEPKTKKRKRRTRKQIAAEEAQKQEEIQSNIEPTETESSETEISETDVSEISEIEVQEIE